MASSLTDKKAMRASMRSTLHALPAAAVAAASSRSCDRVLGLEAVQRATGVSVYLSMPQGECVTTPLIESLLGSGKRVYVPRVYGSGRHEMRMLRIESMAELDNFPRSKWGIPEPSDEQAANMEDGVESGGIDLVVVPAVAFDSRCQRLGHGRGYYDTFLERLKAARLAKGLPPPATVGLGLQEQLVDAVPVAEHDVPLQCVCLPDDLLEAPGLEAR